MSWTEGHLAPPNAVASEDKSVVLIKIPGRVPHRVKLDFLSPASRESLQVRRFGV